MERKLVLCELTVYDKDPAQRGYEQVLFRLLTDGYMDKELGEYARFNFKKSDEIKPGDRFTLVLERIQGPH